MSTTVLDPRSAERSAEKAAAPLVQRLAAADRIVQAERGAVRVLEAWRWIFGSVLAALAADVLLHLGAGSRLAISLGWLLLVAGLIGAGAWIAWGRRHTPEQIARILEARDARLGSKLINVLQLRSQCADPQVSPLTRDLAALAIESCIEELRAEDLAAVARTAQVREAARRLGGAALGFLALLAAIYPVTLAVLPRFLDPFGDHPPYSFTRLEIVGPADDHASVVYGEGLRVAVQAHGHRPGETFLTFHPPGRPAEAVTVPMFDKGEQGFVQQLETVRTDLVLVAHTRDRHSLSRQRRVSVILTPRLERATVTIAAPAYTGLAPEERPLQFKTLKALAGSTLTFQLASNRPLAAGRIRVSAESGTIVPVPLAPGGERTVRGSLVVREPAQLRFTFTDVDGFESQETWELPLIVTHDLPPEVQISDPASDTFVAIDFKPEPVIEARDDYGVARLRIHLARNDAFGEPRVVTFERPPLSARHALPIDFAALGVAPGDRVSIFAEAIDNAPEPHLARSRTVTLSVISTEEYNDFLREQMDLGDIEAKYAQLLAQFHDLAEQQKQLGEKLAQIEKELAAAPNDARREALQREAEAQRERQQKLNAALEEMAGAMENFVRDQPVYDLEAELKQVLAEKAREVRESVEQNRGAMNALPPPSSPGPPKLSPEALAEFRQAATEQAERLAGAEQEAQEQIAQPLEDLSLLHEIVKDMNRFRELHEAQQQLAQQTRAFDREQPLNREDQLALRQMAAEQKAIGDELAAVEQKLWDDGLAAQEKFPKAAQSAKDLAQKMGDLRLQSLAQGATAAMLDANGRRSADLSQNLSTEMEKLFSQCNSQNSSMSGELDQYLSVQRSMKPGRNFQQMMQTRKFGGSRRGFGTGRGEGGRDGYAITTGQANVLGSERPITERDQAKSGTGRNQARPGAAGAEAIVDEAVVAPGATPVNRESSAVQGEAGIEQYSDIVDRYFKALTKPATTPPAKP